LDPTFIPTVLLPAAVGVIMFGLGLALTPADFARVVQFPRAVIAGLLVQTIVLVTAAFAITQLFDLPPLLAVGFMLLAASPGGAMASIFSHLAHGDVALNITLTAINSVLALVWLPLVLNWSLIQFLGAEIHVPAPTQKILEVATVIILPVLIGMFVRCAWPAPARRAAGTVRAASVLLLALVVAISLANSGEAMLQHFGTVGLACITLNLVSLAIGYAVPRLVGLPVAQATSISLEIGIHNAAVAIFVALQVLDSEVASMPAALYGIIMLATAGIAVAWFRRRHAHAIVAALD
jgi:bile acid:Na+ symporter, BASS family